MTKLGIIGAMDVEVETLLSEMEQVASTKKAGSTFHEGVLMGLPVVLVQCGVGKVNAALCVQIMCDCFGVTPCTMILTVPISAIPSVRFRGWMSSRFLPTTRCLAAHSRRRRR